MKMQNADFFARQMRLPVARAIGGRGQMVMMGDYEMAKGSMSCA